MENNQRNQNGKKQNRKSFYTVLMILFLILFFASAIWLVVYFVQTSRAEAQYEAMRDPATVTVTAKPIEPEPTATPEPTTEPTAEPGPEATPEPTANPLEAYEVPEKTLDFDALRAEQNEHIYAWIVVPGTKVDYPIVQHPEQWGYYLDHNLDHSKGYPGCIYTQLNNSKEWDDPMTVVYGHNMKNGTMFASLHQYEDNVFFEENPYIYIYTEDTVRVYEIFAAYEYTDVDLVQLQKMGGKKAYAQYIESIYEQDGWGNNFNTEIEVTPEDQILTLATCIPNEKTSRYLVQGIFRAEGARE